MKTVVSRLWGPNGTRLIIGDTLVLCLLVAGLVTASLPRAADRRPTHAEVFVSGVKALSLDLARDGVHDVLGPVGVTRVEVRAGKVRVLSSPCAQQICRHSGWIDAPGIPIVCLPNEIVIRVPGEMTDGRAAVAR